MEINGQQSFVLNYQYQEYTQYNIRTTTNQGGAERTVDVVGYKSEIFQFSLEVMFNTKSEIGRQASAIQVVNPTDFETTPPEFHLEMTEKLTTVEARELISEDGYFGITKTSERLTEFVIKGSGDNLDRLKGGRGGIIRGFKEAEKIWGGKLPKISYATLNKALQEIDQRIKDLGGSIVDQSA